MSIAIGCFFIVLFISGFFWLIAIESECAHEERKLGIFWNGDMHLPIEGNEAEFLATRGLY